MVFEPLLANWVLNQELQKNLTALLPHRRVLTLDGQLQYELHHVIELGRYVPTRNNALDEIESGSVLFRLGESGEEQTNKRLHLFFVKRIVELLVLVAQREKQRQRSKAILVDLVLCVSH